MIDFQIAKMRLGTWWLILCGIFFTIMFFQTMFGKFEDKVADAWGWALPNILPSLFLIVSVFVSDANRTRNSRREVKKFFFRLSLGLSIFYISLLISILLLQPFTESSLLEIMDNSNMPLGALQGLVSGSIGIFFSRK